MTTRQGPKDPDDETKTARAIAGQVDKLTSRLITVERQLDKVAKGLAIVNQREQKTPVGQPDWLGCRKPAEAVVILESIAAWLEDVGEILGVTPQRCWPWHPRAVVILLAMATHYRDAYGGDSAAGVSDFHIRFMTQLNGRTGITDGCHGEYHLVGEAQFLYDPTRRDDYAIWWATSREQQPPGLRPPIAAVR